ncbi:MAG TPA: hypothetical protein VJH92_04085 [Candidatus Nanoarchaeia archaeon]|nr:hypothetical protein [Candidatus Nanoarchaeia archaeon]
MKRRADYQEMCRKMQELELSMTQGNLEYDALVERYRELGKPDRKIDKTTHWHWLTEKGDFPEMFFYNTPPIGEAQESARILITGTRVETSDMYDILKGSEAYQRVMKELESRRQKRLPESKTKSPLQLPSQPQIFSDSRLVQTVTSNSNPNTTLEEVKPEYVFSAKVGWFWDNFFGEELFLDHPRKISVPCLIVSTEYMRNYNAFGGETINVKERLEEIAIGWDIPIQFIESWAP